MTDELLVIHSNTLNQIVRKTWNQIVCIALGSFKNVINTIYLQNIYS